MVILEPLPASEYELCGRRVWEKLFSHQSNPSAFLHPDVYSVWVRSKWGSSAIQYVARTEKGMPIGSWFLSQRPRRFLFGNGVTAWLNADGGPASDTLFIEYNELLAAPAHEDDVLDAFVSQIRNSHIDQFIVSGAEGRFSSRLRHRFEDWHIEHETWPCAYVDLRAVREAREGYLGLIGPNTRYRIRRTARRFQRAGSLTMQVASSPAEATEWLESMCRLHQRSWRDRGEDGAFASVERRSMHSRLAKLSGSEDLVQILRVCAGDSVIGLLYCLAAGGRVMYYQSGLDYSLDPSAHPGLLLHSVAIQHFADRGYAEYDFLASPTGKDLYKQQLATKVRFLDWVTLTRPSILGSIKRTGLSSYRWIKGRLALASETMAAATE